MGYAMLEPDLASGALMSLSVSHALDAILLSTAQLCEYQHHYLFCSMG